MKELTLKIYNGEYDNKEVDIEKFNQILDNEDCQYWENLGQSGNDTSLLWFDVLYQAENEEQHRFNLYVNKKAYYDYFN